MGFKINRPDVWARLQDLFRLTDSTQLSIEPFVLPTVQLANLEGAQLPTLTRHAVASFVQGATALEFGTARFETVGGTLCHIRKLTAWSTAAVTLQINFPGNATTLAAQANTAAKGFTDGRIPIATEAPAGVLTFGTQVAAITVPAQFHLDLQNSIPFTYDPVNWIIGVGFDPTLVGFLELQLGTLNVPLVVTLEWDEYAVI